MYVLVPVLCTQHSVLRTQYTPSYLPSVHRIYRIDKVQHAMRVNVCSAVQSPLSYC